jgi:hypothetical protein
VRFGYWRWRPDVTRLNVVIALLVVIVALLAVIAARV